MNDDKCKKQEFLLWARDVHLYDTPIEGLIKLLVWICSWIAGIYAADRIGGKGREIACAFFVFADSFLMDYGKGILHKKMLRNRIIYAVVVLSLLLVALVSFAYIVIGSISIYVYNLMYICAIIPLIALGIDVFLWLIIGNIQIINEASESDRIADEKRELFTQKMKSGSLGNVKEQGEG